MCAPFEISPSVPLRNDQIQYDQVQVAVVANSEVGRMELLSGTSHFVSLEIYHNVLYVYDKCILEANKQTDLDVVLVILTNILLIY